jgi:glyceraldehyde 3-phosphate dehydrogenase
MKKIAINGFGRIGRLVFRIIEARDDMEVVAINDLSSPEELAYLLKYDTNHRKYDQLVEHDEENIIVNGKNIRVYKEMEPSNLPWKDLEIDVVLECTGKFTSKEKAMAHIDAGAKKVLISAPGKGEMKTIVYNVNDEILTDKDIIVSAASCTTNCLAPVLKVLDDKFKVIKGNMTTIHAYTNDQVTLDVTHKKGILERRGRACAMNMVPTSTGAAKAIGKVIPTLEGKILGSSIRVPVSDGSLIDLVIELKKKTTKEEINSVFKESINDTLNYTEDPIVSSDIISSTCGATVDGNLTNVIEVNRNQLVHIVAWYDNEMGYSCQMVRTLAKM